MKHVVSRELHAYWNKLRGDRASPERSEVDPTAIRSILADTFIVEVSDSHAFTDREFVVRLSGTRANAVFGYDLRGHSLPSLWCSEDQDGVRELLALVLDEQVPIVAGARAHNQPWTASEFEMMILPLRHYGKTHKRLLGSIATNQAAPLRGMRPVETLALTSFRSVTTEVDSLRAPLRTLPPQRHGRFLVYQGGR